IRSNMGPTLLRRFRAGGFLIGRIVPVDDEWLMSGAGMPLPPAKREMAYEQARFLLARQPKLQYRNPELLALAWDLQAKEQRTFVEFFGGDMIIVPGRELRRAMTDWAHYMLFEARGEDGRTPAETVAQKGEPPPEVPN